jgi:hypothetical protein
VKLKSINLSIVRVKRIVEAETERSGRTIKMIEDISLKGLFTITGANFVCAV